MATSKPSKGLPGEVTPGHLVSAQGKDEDEAETGDAFQEQPGKALTKVLPGQEAMEVMGDRPARSSTRGSPRLTRISRIPTAT